MFELTQLVIKKKDPSKPVLPCERTPNVCIRLEDCTTHEPMADVEVRLGNADENRVREFLDRGLDALPTFSLGGREYFEVAKKRTNAAGWVCFPAMFTQRKKGDMLVLGGYALQVLRPDYRSAADGDANAEVPPGGPTEDFSFTDGSHTVATAVLRSETPLLPPDFDSSVNALVGDVSKVRIGVEQGANLGNQASALSLITNLRRVGYGGPIEVLTDPEFLPYETACTLTFHLFFTDPEGHAAAEQQLLQKLKDRLEGGPVAQRGTLIEPGTRRLAGMMGNVPEHELKYRFPGRVYYTISANDLMALRDLPFHYTVKANPEPEDLGDVDEDVTTGEVEKAGEAIYNLRVTIKLKLLSVSEPSITAKLLTLDPNYKTNPAYGTVQWVERDAFATSELDDGTVVGMVGGHDLGAGVTVYRQERLKTQSLLALQPYEWHPEDRFFQVGDGPVTRLCLPRTAAYFLEPIDPGDVRAFVEACGVAAASAGVIASVIQRVRAGELTLMTAYGIHQAHDSTTATLLNSLAAGSLAAVARGGLARKVVIFAVSKIDIGGMLETPSSTLTTLASAGAPGALEGLLDDHLLVVHSPPLPQSVFQLLAQTSALPVVVEGANTSNQMQMLGKPYVSVSTRYTPYFALPGDVQKGNEKLTRVTSHLNKEGLRNQEAPLGEVATYFHAAASTGDAYGGYFARVRTALRKPEKDQLRFGLYRLAKVREPAERPSVPSDCTG